MRDTIIVSLYKSGGTYMNCKNIELLKSVNY